MTLCNRRSRPGGSSAAILSALAFFLGAARHSEAGIILEVGSFSTNTFSVNNLNRNTTGLTAPVFDPISGALLYPGSSIYPSVIQPAPITQPTATLVAPPTSITSIFARNSTQTTSTSSTIISPTSYGTGRVSTTLSNNISSNGALAGNAGVSFNPGSNVMSSANHPTGQDVAIMTVATASATFLVTSPGFASLTPGVYLDVEGYVHGGPGSFVAVGLFGTITVNAPNLGVVTNSFQLVGAYAGAGTEITPAGGSFNDTSAPAPYQFEATGNVTFPQFATVSQDAIITINTTLTLMADPDSYIQLTTGSSGHGIIPDFGVFSGGPVGENDLVASPEPSTLLALLTAVPFAAGLLRRRRGAARRTGGPVERGAPARLRVGSIAVALVLTGVLAGPATAGLITITASTTENGVNRAQGSNIPVGEDDLGGLIYTPTAHTAPPAAPYDFGSAAASLKSLTSLTVTLTIGDGDTGPGDFDEGNLTLGLDGIDTGIVLNGFNNNQVNTLSFTATPLSAPAILAALQTDGKLIGSVFDRIVQNNVLLFPLNAGTTLSLTGSDTAGVAVPEPATIVSAGIATIVGWVLTRRSRRA